MIIGEIQKGVWHLIAKRERHDYSSKWEHFADAVMEIGQAKRAFDEGQADMAQKCGDTFIYQFVRLRLKPDDNRIPFFDQKLALKKVTENLQRGIPQRGRAQPQG